jgi:polyisoprenoid-binding protein YceI
MPRSYLALLIAIAVSAGCGSDNPTAQERPTPETPAAAQPRAAAEPVAAQRYTVDAASSEVFWRISKAGLMARFGHNHVISAREFTGSVTVDPADATKSRFELEIPVDTLVVDDPELRARFGEEFASVPSEEDKTGTRTNMLGDGVLKAAMFPVVRVRGGELMGEGNTQTAAIEIDILGNTHEFRVPCVVMLADGSLEAAGEFGLDHAELGMMPFSALGGALQVGERIEFSYRIRAVQPAGQ